MKYHITKIKERLALILGQAPFIVVTPPFLIGISLSRVENPMWVMWLAVALSLLAIVPILRFKNLIPIVVIAFATIGFIAGLSTIPTPQLPKFQKAQFVAQITSQPITKGRYQQSQAKILLYKDSTQNWTTPKTTYCQISVDTSQQKIKQGNIITYHAKTYPFDSTFNKYYLNKNIEGKQYVYHLEQLGQDSSLQTQIQLQRSNLAQKLTQISPDTNTVAIAQTLTLGLQQNIDHQTKQAYRKAGVSHLLAISGLHVGIIFGILNALLFGLNISKTSRWIKFAIIITTLWLYAIMSGLAPSVIRAVSMFTILQIGLALNRRNLLNTLLIAALLMTIYNPNYLFDIGFQLSFLAMIGITILYPTIRELIPKRGVIGAIWSVTAVSLTAQLFTTPLVAYTFGEISIISLATNMIVWISLPIIITSSFLFLLTQWSTVATITSTTITLQNQWINLFANLKFATIPINNLSPITLTIIYSLLLIATTSILIAKKNQK